MVDKFSASFDFTLISGKIFLSSQVNMQMLCRNIKSETMEKLQFNSTPQEPLSFVTFMSFFYL